MTLAEKFNSEFKTNLSYTVFRNFKRNHKLRSGVVTRFKKGSIPINKGVSWDEYMPKDKQINCLKTTFKKGDMPKNTAQIGDEVIRGDGFIQVKIASPNIWKLKHRIIYEEFYKIKLSKNEVLMFIDGDRSNCDIKNLQLMTKKEMLYFNKMGKYHIDKDATLSEMLISKIKIQTLDKKKGNKE